MVNLKKQQTIREIHPNFDEISYEEQVKKEYSHLNKKSSSIPSNIGYREMQPTYVDIKVAEDEKPIPNNFKDKQSQPSFDVQVAEDLSKETALSPVLLFDYSLNDGEVTITKYNGNSSSVTVPSEINGYPVTSIGESAFEGCKSLKEIDIPYLVEHIGEHAFYDCESLTSIIIPNSVTEIGRGAFAYCSSLSIIDIPDLVTSIGESAFLYCSRLEDVVISDKTNISGSSFSGCSKELHKQIYNTLRRKKALFLYEYGEHLPTRGLFAFAIVLAPLILFSLAKGSEKKLINNAVSTGVEIQAEVEGVRTGKLSGVPIKGYVLEDGKGNQICVTSGKYTIKENDKLTIEEFKSGDATFLSITKINNEEVDIQRLKFLD